VRRLARDQLLRQGRYAGDGGAGPHPQPDRREQALLEKGAAMKPVALFSGVFVGRHPDRARHVHGLRIGRVAVMDVFLHPAVVAAITVMMGAGLGWLAARAKAQPDMQTVTNAAVAGVIGHYIEALTLQTAEVHSLRTDIEGTAADGRIAERRDRRTQ